MIECYRGKLNLMTCTHLHFGLVLKDLEDSSLAEEEQDSLDQSLVSIYKSKGLVTAP